MQKLRSRHPRGTVGHLSSVYLCERFEFLYPAVSFSRRSSKVARVQDHAPASDGSSIGGRHLAKGERTATASAKPPAQGEPAQGESAHGEHVHGEQQQRLPSQRPATARTASRPELFKTRRRASRGSTWRRVLTTLPSPSSAYATSSSISPDRMNIIRAGE